MKHDRPAEILEALKRNFRENCLHHAYIFVGAAGAGKYETVLRFAAFLFHGEEKEVEARILRSGHPDFVVIEPKEDGPIRVDDVRELPRMISYAPLEGARRVVVIKSAESLNSQAANAILKLLEEPPPHTLFFLLVPDAGLLLQTIRSRCQLLRFFPLSEQEILARLPEAVGNSAIVAARWAEGSLERAKNYLADESLRETRTASRHALLTLWGASPRIPSESLRILEGLTTNEQALSALDTWYSLSRDMALILSDGAEMGLYHEDARTEILNLANSIRKKVKNKIPLEELRRELVDKCSRLHRLRVAFGFHVNQKLALDQVLCDLQLFSVGKIGQTL